MLPRLPRKFYSSLILPVLFPFLLLFASSSLANLPPVAADDSYTRHGSGTIGPVLQNDFDPDGDPIVASVVSFPAHGSLGGLDGNSFSYRLNVLSFTGTDTFTYQACDNRGACSNVATVTINVVNQAPVAVDDSYVVHGITNIGPFLINDSDPDGDEIHFLPLTFPTHGTLFGTGPDTELYGPNPNYVGPDSFTYSACDALFACSTPATVMLDVNPSPTPTPTPTPMPTPTPTATPTPPPPPVPPSPTPTPTEPLIFIPGIAGSKLSEVGGNNIWPALFRDLSKLSLDPQQPQANIFVPDVIRTASIFFGLYTEVVYTPLLNELSNEGYREYKVNNDPTRRTTAGCDLTQKHEDPSENPNLFIFAYDWRESNADNSTQLKAYMRCVQMFYPNTKVNVLAHSMGGLLARRYIIDNPGTHNVNKLITIATPWLGAPKAIHVLETGNFFNKFIVDPLFAADMKKLVEFFPGAHETLPGRSYFKLGGHPFGEATWDYDKSGRLEATYDTSPDRGYTRLVSALDRQHPRVNPGPGTVDTRFHDKVGQDDWRGDQSGVQYYYIYGVQKLPRTIGKAIAISETICDSPGVNCNSVNSTKFEKVYGDGTAPLLSTERIGNGLNLNASGSIKIPFTSSKPADDDSYEHSFLTQNPKVWAAIRTALAPANPQQAKVESTKSRANILAHHKLNARSSFTLDDQPTQVEGAPGYYLHATGIDFINVSDAYGNTNTPVEGILFSSHVPGVDYEVNENSIDITAPADQSFTLTFRSSGQPVLLEILKGVGNSEPSQAIRYLDLSLPAGIVAKLEIKPIGVEDLRYDGDRDGTFETVITPSANAIGTAALDTVAPEITFSETQQGTKIQVSITATDSGFGVKALRYSLDGSHFLKYTEPLLIDPGQTPSVFAFADDNVANRSAIAMYAVPMPPSITAPPNLVLNTGSNAVACGVTIDDDILGTASASSNSSGIVTVTRGGVPSGNFFSVGTSSITYTATDPSGLTATATQSVTVTDNTPPMLSCPVNVVVSLPLNSTATSMTLNYSIPSVSDNCSGPISLVSTPVSGSVFQVGATSVSASATDAAGNASSCGFTITVLYDFSGFFSPVGNPPVLNAVNAGRAVPIKFSLSGDKGLNVFATVPSNPGSSPISCDATAPAVEIPETVAAGNSSLSYDAANDQYTYVWKTDSSWVGTCRQLVLQLNDGSTHRANFKFK